MTDELPDTVIRRDYEAGERAYCIIAAPYGGWTFWEQLAIMAEVGVTMYFEDPTCPANLMPIIDEDGFLTAIRLDEL